MKRAIVFLFLLSMLSALMGCGAGYGNPPSAVTELEAAQEQTQPEKAKTGTPEHFIPANEAKDEGSSMLKELTLTADGTVIPVIWEDNPSTAELTRRAAEETICIEMNLYGDWEQVGSLGFSIPRNDAQLTADSGDIMLYCGNQVVLFYGKNTWAYTKLGHIQLSDDAVTNLLSSRAVKITLTVS